VFGLPGDGINGIMEGLRRNADRVHAYPGRQVIAYIGDGGFAMLMAEFHTAAWHRLPIKVVINNNNSLGQILWEQMVLGYPEHGVRFGTPLPDYAAWAKAAGGFGAHVEKPGDLPSALTEAFAYPGPALVDVAVDPNEPPMPGKVTTSRRRSSPRRSCTASRTRRPSRRRCSRTASSSSRREPWPWYPSRRPGSVNRPLWTVWSPLCVSGSGPRYRL
jgi:thiamine pyrophosphate-dependent acetolactate synthase large subunit-like protein